MQKVDYGEIPDLKEKWAALQTAIQSNKVNEAKDALTAFRLATIASPDLIASDARALVAKAKVDEAFEATAALTESDDSPLDPLSSLELYRSTDSSRPLNTTPVATNRFIRSNRPVSRVDHDTARAAPAYGRDACWHTAVLNLRGNDR